jgi:large subunit ribosomal protein L18
MYADKSKIRRVTRIARHARIRRKLEGSTERPRLCVRRSLNHIYAQIVDDATGQSLVQVSSMAADVRGAKADKSKSDLSREVGKLVATKALEKGIKQVVFDRGGYAYHGRVKAVADAAREAGLEF